MEIRKTEKQFQEVEVLIEQYTICDKCNEKIKLRCDDAFEFSLEYKTGYSYYDSGGGEKKEMDLCPKCADECIKLLKDNGYRINESEWDFY